MAARAELLRGLYGGRPFSPKSPFYAPALLPISTDLFLQINQWLNHQLNIGNDAQVPPNIDELVMGLARLQASVTNHYRLCKPLARESFPVQQLNDQLLSHIRQELETLHAEIATLYTVLTQQCHWPIECWNAFQAWASASTPIILALGYHDALSHAAQVARWCVLHAQAIRPNQPWFALQAAMVGWFHDPKLHIRFSIDNLATHPVMASLMATQLLQQAEIAYPLSAAWQACHPHVQQNQRASGLASATWDIAEALRINSDSRYVISQVIQPQLGRQLPTPELRKTWDNWIEGRMAHRTDNNNQLCPPPSELRHALSDATLHSGFIGLDATLWHEATKWWVNCAGQQYSPSMLYQTILRGEVSNHQKDMAETVAQWLDQAAMMGESPFIHWQVPGTLLLAHHWEVSNPDLADCLAFADPLMLSPHKVLAARPSDEPFYLRLASYMDSMGNNLSDLTTTVGKQTAQLWFDTLTQTIWTVAQPLTPYPADTTALIEPSYWPAHIAHATEDTEPGKAALQGIYQQLKHAFDQAELTFIKGHLRQ